MTTFLGKPVARVTPTVIRDGSKRRLLVVTIHPEYITLRPIGTRREETVSLEAMYFGAIKARVFREKMEKAKARKAKRGAK